MDWQLLVAFGFGVVWGYTVRWWAGRTPAPGPRLRRITFATTAPGLALQSHIHRERWDLALTVFCFHGNMRGWSQRVLCHQDKLLSRGAWYVYTRLLRDEGILCVQEGRPTRFSGGWSYGRLRSVLKHRLLAPPYPEIPPPPIYSSRGSSAAGAV